MNETAEETKDEKGKRSGRPGRAARRRRRKVRSIQEAEEAIRAGHKLEPASVLPSDRSQVWAAVYERRTFHKWSKDDETMLVGQLGYVPGNVINISTRAERVACLKKASSGGDDQAPAVVQLYPMVLRVEYEGGKSDGRRFKSRKRRRQNEDNEKKDEDKSLIEPFPTIYWLTHPMLRVLVSKLELGSLGSEIEKRLASDSEAMASMKRAHESYGKERQQLLTESDRALVRERKWDSAFAENRGVAGIRNHAAIKCLHAHAAHFLSGGSGSSDNVVGQWVMEEVEKLLEKNTEKEDA
jgi:hypothetical protein